MFRSDRDALAQEVEDLRHEREHLRAQNEAMRADILARRQADPPALASGSVYKRGVDHLSPGEQTALARCNVEAFPPWAAVVLHFFTLGIFSLVHFSSLHGRLPKVEHDDPTPAKAIGFSFIPYFNVYWTVFNTMRLVDRINLQFRLRGLPDRVPRGFLLATAIVTASVGVFPYLYFLVGGPLLWPFAVYFLQRAVNALAVLQCDAADVAVAGAAADVAVAGAAADAPSPWVAPPRVRVPLVKDLPGPDDVAVEQQADAEAEADAAFVKRAR